MMLFLLLIFINEEQFKSSVDNYFGDLINYTSKKGLSVLLIFIPHIKSNKNKLIKYLTTDKGYDSYLLDENIISFKEKFRTLISLIKDQKFIELYKKTSGFNSF